MGTSIAPITINGLGSGLDTNSIISKLMSIARAPEQALQTKITNLQAQKIAINNLTPTLLTLSNMMDDFNLGVKFDTFNTPSSDTGVATAAASSSNPSFGTYQVEVDQLASATVARSSNRLGSAINPAAALSSSGIVSQIQAGTFSINGVQFNVNPATDSLNSIIAAINSSAAGVTASYNSATDKITFSNTAANNTAIINFGASADTSNLLTVLGAKGAFQSTGSNGSTTVTGSQILGAVGDGSVLNTVNFAGGAVTAGSFQINGVAISVDPTTDTLGNVLAKINSSDAGVTATYDGSTDTIKIVSKNLGSRSISFQGGTSNFLSVTNLTTATQTAGNDSQYKIDGGPVQTANSNTVTTGISGVTLTFTGLGTTSVSVGNDVAGAIQTVQDFVTAFNNAVSALATDTAKGGPLENDQALQSISNFLLQKIFTPQSGLPGQVQSLLDIGVSTGPNFDVNAVPQLQVDTTKLTAALTNNPDAVKQLFSNASNTGIANTMYGYINSVANTSGFLYDEAHSGGTIDTQIQSINDQIKQMERNLALYQQTLQSQFLQLETMSTSLQSQGASLTGLLSGSGSSSSSSSSNPLSSLASLPSSGG